MPGTMAANAPPELPSKRNPLFRHPFPTACYEGHFEQNLGRPILNASFEQCLLNIVCNL